MEVKASIEIDEKFIDEFANTLTNEDLIDFIVSVDDFIANINFTARLIESLTESLFKDLDDKEKEVFLENLKELM
jgi:N-glycosylase/DNA lyase